jgi:plasmid stability protein
VVKKNFTLALPAGLIQAAKVLAAKRGTSVNALVKENLEQMVRAEDEYQAALRRILSPSRKNLYRIEKRHSRAELYE